MKVKGHQLTAESAEGEWSGTCPCGWAENGSTRQVVRDEFQYHLRDVKQRSESVNPTIESKGIDMNAYEVAISGPYVQAHTRVVQAESRDEAEAIARSMARASGLDVLYASFQATEATGTLEPKPLVYEVTARYEHTIFVEARSEQEADQRAAEIFWDMDHEAIQPWIDEVTVPVMVDDDEEIYRLPQPVRQLTVDPEEVS